MKSKREDIYKNEIIGIIFCVIAILSILSLYTKSTGILGYNISILLKGLFGIGAYVVSLLILVFAFLFLFKKSDFLKTKKVISLLIIFLCFISIDHLYYFNNVISIRDYIAEAYKNGIKNIGGGMIASIILYVLLKLIGIIGTLLFLSASLIICSIIITDISFVNSIKMLLALIKNKINNKKIIVDDFEKTIAEVTITKENQDCNDLEENNIEIVQPILEEKVKSNNQKPDMVPANKNNGNYNFPPLTLLKDGNQRQKINNNIIIENVKKLEQTLLNFGIEAKVIQVTRGPAITRFELQPNPGIKVSRIVSLTDDISLSLAAPSVRIEAPIPGKSAIGLEVPNDKISIVTLKEVIDTNKFKNHKSDLSIALGKDIAGNVIVTDLAKMPHLLIAGATGSGKSVCINTLIISLLYKALPDKVKMILIDPKVVELNIYNGIPHLLTPVVTDPKKAAGVLNWAVQEMTNRYKMFADINVRDIEGYNRINKENHMSKIVIIIDELSDLMMVSPSEVEEYICRLAQMARAAGIYLVIATQRPSVDVITGVIKANIPSRISFAVTSQIDSRTILDMAGAEKLLGKGDMLFYPIGEAKPLRVQGAFISDKEVEDVVNFLKLQAQPEYTEINVETKFETIKSIGEDELIKDAIAVILDTGQASISMLQRRLRIGYARAARIIDQMEEKGIISGYDGSKPRQILLTEDEIKKIIND
ncbi:cell division protein FtsK [Aceticella autotrophica]|uniref:Cell division protein FtsK n=1 Tax=Aceticella autotrophica TaxID=2755338 RepID=A0A975AXH2_9THEO|nr:DNA translocase FtsK [Aceticella autotrophica]QSZ28267.1 cell division protein FtsK [Aceticella autotrophica]